MKRAKAKKEAKEWYDQTGEHAFVVDLDGTFEWFAECYFDNGFEGGTIVYGTNWN